jgi:adrenodoxin-NADP+ reductase
LPFKAAASQPLNADRHLHFQFYRNPVEVVADTSGAASAVRVERTQLQVLPGGGMVAVGTGEFETHECQLVLKSIGYKSLQLEGAAFDARAGVIPNRAGRVLKGGCHWGLGGRM